MSLGIAMIVAYLPFLLWAINEVKRQKKEREYLR